MLAVSLEFEHLTLLVTPQFSEKIHKYESKIWLKCWLACENYKTSKVGADNLFAKTENLRCFLSCCFVRNSYPFRHVKYVLFTVHSRKKLIRRVLPSRSD